MNPDTQKHLARAAELLEAAEAILGLGYPADSISRAYYAIFHGATAVLLELDIRRNSHRGVWAAFGQFVTKPGLMDVSHHHAGIRLFSDRSRSDYLAEPGSTAEDAERTSPWPATSWRPAGHFWRGGRVRSTRLVEPCS